MRCGRLICLLMILLACAVKAQVYPSTGAAWLFPGGWEEPLSTSRFHSAEAVKQWELHHADLVLGSWQSPALNQQSHVLFPSRLQDLACDSDLQRKWLSRQADLADVDAERLFLHYAEDTRLSWQGLASSSFPELPEPQPRQFLTELNGQFSPANLPVNLLESQSLILIADEPFTVLELEVDRPPAQLLWQSPIGWQLLDVRWQQQGETRYTGYLTMPEGWQPSVLTGATSEAAWTIALRWPQETRVASLRLQPWLTQDANGLFVPGWDPVNDKDQNGLLSDDEFQSRVNLSASARFPYQARVLVRGRHPTSSCAYRVNLSDPAVQNLLIGWYRYHWRREGAAGGYLQQLKPLLTDRNQSVVSGGQLLELPFVAGTPEAEDAYFESLMVVLGMFKRQLSPPVLAADVSGLALWQENAPEVALKGLVDVWVRPRLITPAMGLAKLQQSWQPFALSADGAQRVLMVSMRDGYSDLHPGNSKAWTRDVETGLALYYLFNQPGLTYYHNWGRSLTYDSANTTARDWSRPGLPKNWVYQPFGMLKVDLGIPVAAPKGYKAVWWQAGSLRGDSRKPALGAYPVIPANWFWLYRSGWFSRQPAEGVIARRYTHGLVVYRAVQEAGQQRFQETRPMRISLPGTYEQIFYDGSVSEPINYIELGGYQGAVLRKSEQEK
ncbi:hypothetical protein [Photobacterium galatheae]|uniref:EF-hand domain-containing protein n=1 Tax=Photobacterium galatheae TaxID=1654360 RepID=A0A066RYV9_9GAMM|nr:hypothetical protein [Photobacterium galatheae]KDM92573.1 hypothetical protein EA58_05605 [Photobacterium galatheae]MCM0147618.1 hypothetical protein [Photobacterium galatheae]